MRTLRTPIIQLVRFLSGGFLLFSYFSATSATDTLDIQSYYSRLEGIRLRLAEIHSPSDAEILKRTMATYREAFVVILPPRQSQQKFQKVSLAWVPVCMEKSMNEWGEEVSPEQYTNLKNELDSLLQHEQKQLAALGGPEFDVQRARENAQNILKDKIYQFEKEEDDENEDAEEIAEPRDRTVERGFQAGYKILVLLAVIIVLGFLIYRLNKYLENKKIIIDPESIQTGGLLRENDPRESSQLLKKGTDTLQAGNSGEAIRYYYLYLIIRLHELRTIRYNAAFTNWEYYHAMKKASLNPDAAWSVTRVFDESHYGGKAIPDDKLSEYVGKIHLLAQSPES